MNLRAVRSVRGGLILAGAVLIAAIAAVGTVMAAQPTPPPGAPPPGSTQPERGRFLDVVAAKLGIAPERLRQAFSEAHQEMGPQRREGPGGFSGRVRGMLGNGLRITAETIEISPEQLRSELPGSSVAAVARAHGVDPQRVTAALTTAAIARIDAGSAAGRITQDQATNMKQRVSAMIERFVNREIPNRPPGGRGPDGSPFGPFGPRPDGPSGPGPDGPFGPRRSL